MPASSRVELKDLVIEADIGTYGPHDVVPDAHWLDLVLHIAPERVMIPRDAMALVFDYDPLIDALDALARDGHYETQERLMTRMAEVCAGFPEIEALEIALRKSPVLRRSGSLGVRLVLDAEALAALRSELPQGA